MAWTLTNADVISAFPLLADFHEKADGGSTTTLECKRLLHLSDVEVIGSTITILTGTNAGTDVLITSYASSTTATFGFSALSNPIDSSVGFGIVLMDYTSVINRAYNIIVNEMRNKRQDADNNDIYHESYLLFKEQYESELTTLKADYDEDEDGVIQESEEDISNQVVLRK